MDYESKIYSIWSKIASKTSCQDADRIIAPVTWYINTGRISGNELRLFCSMSSKVASRLSQRITDMNGMDYDGAIEFLKECLK